MITKLCECGCGLVAPLAKQTDKRKGHVKGESTRYIKGHHQLDHDPRRRFLNKVEKVPDGCWLWRASRKPTGYGKFGYQGRMCTAHRVAYELFVGAIPPGMCVLHRCDVPQCVNPDHLRLGTQADNLADCHAKGRRTWSQGEGIHTAKLTEQDVREMRRLRGTATAEELGRRFGITKTPARDVLAGRSWRHVV